MSVEWTSRQITRRIDREYSAAIAAAHRLHELGARGQR